MNLLSKLGGGIDPYRHKWRIVPKVHCGVEKILFLVVIHTRPRHFLQRQILREIYAPRLSQNSAHILFAVGGISSNDNVQMRLESESRKTHDIIQMELRDDRRNLLIKILSWLRYVDENCGDLKYVLKIDDNILFNMESLLEILGPTDNEKRSSSPIICNETAFGEDRFRWCNAESDKNEQTIEHCSGQVYALDAAVARGMLETIGRFSNAMVSKLPLAKT
ncbi:unnamed protein product [Toxocara canis]|uniref:Hexosyltransferase n=1 Tax=Toxocara canis TaxID=6265 RepID=A0A183TZX1_TOXCA|nr:unnamed protein product [Toxocara canis]